MSLASAANPSLKSAEVATRPRRRRDFGGRDEINIAKTCLLPVVNPEQGSAFLPSMTQRGSNDHWDVILFRLRHSSWRGWLPLDLGAQAPQNPIHWKRTVIWKVETSCSKVSPGVGIADVSWKGSQTSVSRDARDTTTQVQLLVTTVKDGFSTGAAVKVWPSSGKERVGSGLGASDHRLDPLRGLAVAPAPNSVASGRSPSKSPQAASQQERSNSIRIQNLQPGINYIWRLQRVHNGTFDSSNTVTTAAPVCAVDFKK